MSNEINSKLNKIIKRIVYSSSLKIAGIYTFSNFANAAIPFFLLPILTRYLSPADYGMTAVFGMFLGLCIPFIGLNSQIAISVKYFKMDKLELSKYVSSCLLITVITCFLLIIFFVIFNSWIEKTSNFPVDWLWTVVVVSLSSSILGILLVILRSSRKAYHYSAIQLSQTVMNMGLSVWFVVWLNMNWQGRITAQIIAGVVFAGISLYLLYKNRWLIFQYNAGYIKDALKFGVPLLPSTLSSFAMTLADRFIIVTLIGLSEAGIYTVGVQFAMVIGLIMNSFNSTYTPWLYNKLNSATEVTKSKIILMTYAYIIGMLILVVVFSGLMPFVFKFFIDARYSGALTIIFWSCLAQVFAGAVNIVGKYIHYAEKTNMVLLINIPVSIFHLLFCYIMVNENGIVGAAQAATVSYLIRLLLFAMMSNKLYPMPWLSFYKNLRF